MATSWVPLKFSHPGRLQGRQAVYVDFENAPPIDADNPPDLKAVADGAQPTGAAVAQASEKSEPAKTASTGKAQKKAAKVKASSDKKVIEGDDANALTEIFLAKVKILLLRHQGALCPDLHVFTLEFGILPMLSKIMVTYDRVWMIIMYS